jgi:hypothetical protein
MDSTKIANGQNFLAPLYIDLCMGACSGKVSNIAHSIGVGGLGGLVHGWRGICV